MRSRQSIIRGKPGRAKVGLGRGRSEDQIGFVVHHETPHCCSSCSSHNISVMWSSLITAFIPSSFLSSGVPKKGNECHMFLKLAHWHAIFEKPSAAIYCSMRKQFNLKHAFLSWRKPTPGSRCLVDIKKSRTPAHHCHPIYL